MRVIHEGYIYGLEAFDGGDEQQLAFIEKEDRDGQFVTVSDGTTNEEVLKVLIHRLTYQSKKLPSRETSIAITKLEEALLWLQKRTQDRIARGVEGTPNP